MKELPKILVTFLFGSILGIGLLKFIDSPVKFEWEGKIGPEQFVDILVALVIAGFLGHAIQKTLDVQRMEKSWVSETFREAINLLREMKVDFESTFRSGVSRKDAVERFVLNHRRFSNYISEAIDLSDLLGHKEDHLCDDLLLKSTLYKAVVSNGPPSDPFDSLDNTKHELKYKELRKALLLTLVELGRK